MFSIESAESRLEKAFSVADEEFGVSLRSFWKAMSPELQDYKKKAIAKLTRRQHLNPTEIALLLLSAHAYLLEIEEWDYVRKKLKDLRSKGRIRMAIENRFTVLAEHNRASYSLGQVKAEEDHLFE